jgi:hypothetical protein
MIIATISKPFRAKPVRATGKGKGTCTSEGRALFRLRFISVIAASYYSLALLRGKLRIHYPSMPSKPAASDKSERIRSATIGINKPAVTSPEDVGYSRIQRLCNCFGAAAESSVVYLHRR